MPPSVFWISIRVLMIVLLFVLMFALIAFGLEIWAAMGVSAILYMLIRGEMLIDLVASKMVEGVDHFSLVAIPFFMLVGEVMNASGITKRLADFVHFFVGRLRGGLAYVAIIVNMIAAGVSGSAVADASAVSAVLLPLMEKKGYDKPFSAAINAAAAVAGPVIPPSIPMVFIGVISGISIGKLFLGGIIPGFLMCLSLCIFVFFVARRKNYPVERVSMSWSAFIALFRDALFALIAPLLIVSGVVFGIVTIVEVAIISAFYVLFIATCVYRTLPFREVPKVFRKAAVFSTVIMMIFASIGVYSYVVVFEQLGATLADLFISLNLGRYSFLMAANIFFLFMGLIIDAVPVMLIFFPVLLPISTELGIDPTHFGVIVVINLVIGLLTPPVGALLFLEAKLADISFKELNAAVWPMTLTLLSVLVLATYFPAIVMFIPNLLLGM
ncbi:MAG: TRAP transporter large permease subunit [Proteobacteria bacterium]|nr:TRAP transporter large permease subunit [Pseudomonadota bacterium]NIS69206.1 TRAP transporter large permease subunit [Pseudomonadota bacterium]